MTPGACTTDVLLEGCVDTLGRALAVQQGGAGRIELCANLAAEGTTPDDDLLSACVAHLTIPVVPIIRLRAGPFIYDSREVETMIRQVHRARDLGASGVAVGALAADGTVDRDAVAQLRKAADRLPVTFHRAFDAVRDQSDALETLIALGVDRVLTSGGARTALIGVEQLARLVRQSAGRIAVMAGGSVRGHNVREIVSRTGVGEIHARLSSAEDARRVLAGALRPSAV